MVTRTETEDPLAGIGLDDVVAEIESRGAVSGTAEIEKLIEREEQRRYLAAYRKIGQRLSAARHAKVSWGKVLRWEKSKRFQRRSELTLQEHVEGVIQEAYRRAIVGNPRMKFYKGDPITIWNEETKKHEPYIEYKQSDKLLIELLSVLDSRFQRTVAKTEVNISNQNNLALGVIENPAFYGNAAHDLIGEESVKVIEVES